MTSEEQPINQNTNKFSRSQALWGFTIFLVVITVLIFLYWLLVLQYYEYTDDAYANGNKITIHSSVSGAVVAFFADDTDLVEEGQILALLDSTEYKVAYDKALASLAASALQIKQLASNAEAAKANVEKKRIALTKAKFDYDNRTDLVTTLAISNEDFTHSRDTLISAEADLLEAQNQFQSQLDALGNTPLKEHPILVEKKNQVLQAYYNLNHCTIYSPAKGYVAQRAINVGQWVIPTMNLMAVVPTDYVWVDANYKETQLQYMRVGQPATVSFDLYGSKAEIQGKVIGIGMGTGSAFSLIPPQNATGNWIKIVQRIPVRIGLNREQLRNTPLRIGISALVNVDISNQSLPYLARKEVERTVEKTNIYDLSFDKVNGVINGILKKTFEPDIDDE